MDFIFTNYETFQAALKAVSVFIRYRFQSISARDIEEIASDALLTAYQYQASGRLTIPVIAFAKSNAFRRAIDLTRKQATRHRQGFSFVDADFAREMPSYTEGSYFESNDADTAACLAAITRFVLTLPEEAALLFDADSDSVLSKMKDRELANYLGFKVNTESATKKKRFDTKNKAIRVLEATPQYQRLKVAHERRHAA